MSDDDVKAALWQKDVEHRIAQLEDRQASLWGGIQKAMFVMLLFLATFWAKAKGLL